MRENDAETGSTTLALAYDPTADGWKKVSRSGFMEVAGPLWTRKVDGAWQYGILAEAKHLNPAGVVHGGALITLVDHAVSTIAWEACGRVTCLTVQLDNSFLGAVKAGQFVVATGRVVRKTSSLVFVQGSATVDGEEVFICTSVMKILKPR